MEYSIKEISEMAGISTRTLRYYDQIGLLSSKRENSNNYRVYNQNEIDLLQQILLYKELGLELKEIQKIISSSDYNPLSAMENHLENLLEKQKNINLLIKNVKKTILNFKGEKTMTNDEKFLGLKQEIIDKNESKYGKQVREKFGDISMDKANEQLKNMTEDQFNEIENLSNKINETLKQAKNQGDPSSDLAQSVCKMHKDWISFYWGYYDKSAHKELANSYVEDERFKKYYENIEPGCAEFLRNALLIFCK